MNWLNNFLWFSTGLVWSAILIWTVIATKDWFVKVNGYKDDIRILSSRIHNNIETAEKITDFYRVCSDARIKGIHDRLEKLEGKKRK